MNIRPARIEDIPQILKVEQGAASAAHWSAEKYQEIFNGVESLRRMLIAEDDSALQAFIVARMLGDEWEIENIAVAQSSQRRGLGSALLQRLLEEARTEKAQSILLEVRESNLVARTFYEKFFFSEYGRRAGYYHNPSESAILYRLCL